MANAAREAGVRITGGDTKVVEHGKADRMYITTTGIGTSASGVKIDPRIRAVRRQGPALGPDRRPRHHHSAGARGTGSSKPICVPIRARFFRWWRRWRAAAGPGIRWMRDPTRGGAATSLNELARDCGLGIVLYEDKIPVRDAVRGACELLGLDPLHIANEGQFLAVVAPEYADAALNALSRRAGRRASSDHRRSLRAARRDRCWRPHRTAAAGSSTCWWAIRCRESVRSGSCDRVHAAFEPAQSDGERAWRRIQTGHSD